VEYKRFVLSYIDEKDDLGKVWEDFVDIEGEHYGSSYLFLGGGGWI